VTHGPPAICIVGFPPAEARVDETLTAAPAVGLCGGPLLSAWARCFLCRATHRVFRRYCASLATSLSNACSPAEAGLSVVLGEGDSYRAVAGGAGDLFTPAFAASPETIGEGLKPLTVK
jgi:hypothetical protein